MHLSILERALLLFLTTSASASSGSLAAPDLSGLALAAGAAGVGAEAGGGAGLDGAATGLDPVVGPQVPSNLAALGSFVHALPDVCIISFHILLALYVKN